MNVKLLASAKINLILAVGERLSNGYHSIETVMQTVSLFDEVDIEVNSNSADSDIRISVSGEFAEGVPADEQNTCYKAAKIFADRGFHIHIRKNIPNRAGLGGGSSDAAAVIVGMAKILGRDADVKQLELAACTVGADVPFFIRGGLQLCNGIGMDLHETAFDWGLEDDKPPQILIAKGEDGCSTKEAYERLDKVPQAHSFKPYYNSFDELSKRTEIYGEEAFIRRMMTECGARAVCLSGSGSAVYGVFQNNQKRLKAKKILRDAGLFAAPVEPVAYGSKSLWAQI
jgi:4-diphosphocytidyl-2-C-methyl-D-erythritol kinase